MVAPLPSDGTKTFSFFFLFLFFVKLFIFNYYSPSGITKQRANSTKPKPGFMSLPNRRPSKSKPGSKPWKPRSAT